MTGMILVDLQKAFDTIDRDIPLKQMSVMVSQIMLLISSNHTCQIIYLE